MVKQKKQTNFFSVSFKHKLAIAAFLAAFIVTLGIASAENAYSHAILPREIILQILPHLDVHTKLQFRAVCKDRSENTLVHKHTVYLDLQTHKNSKLGQYTIKNQTSALILHMLKENRLEVKEIVSAQRSKHGRCAYMTPWIFKTLCDMLRVNTTITSLTIPFCNRIGVGSMPALKKALKHNSILTDLTIENVDFGDDCMPWLKKIVTYKTLKTLTLHVTQLSPASKQALQNAKREDLLLVFLL